MTRDESQSPDHVTDHDNLSDDAGSDDNSIDFGFRQVNRADKAGLVRGVFDSVANRYDLMNDLMSGGVHRLWKAAMIDWMAPQPHQTLIDLAGGTGDIGQRFLRAGGGFAHITDINESMLMAGKKRRDLQSLANKMNWCNANAEQLPFADNAADFVTIAFGLRNVTDRPAALAEAHRVLKAGGRFLCLEFSQVDSAVLQRLYDTWSFSILPTMGQMVAGDAESYRYLVESIAKFPNQENFAVMIRKAGFDRVTWRDYSGGIAALHSGWKL